MKLSAIYEKEINRRINPVAVVSELNDELIKQEIEEYVFTPDIYKYQYQVLDAVINSKGERTGIWINGYYGSGKSHFLKYLFYCFSQTHQSVALEHFEQSLRAEKKELTLELAERDITYAKINEIGKRLHGLGFDAIMFNIDTVSGDISHREAITKIFLNQLNKYQGYNGTYISLAKLERQLDKAEKFQEFKKAIKTKLKEDWDKKSADLAEIVLEEVLDIAKGFITLDEKSFRASIERALSGKEELSVVDLVQHIEEFLEGKPANHRVVFLVDEVSQYIGSNLNLLLNLQSIIEEIGVKCKGKVWVICTAQQEIKEVIENTGQSHTDFGKIMARFEVKIPLKSNEYNDIIKKRILAKKAEGVAELNTLFSKKKNIIENQFTAISNLFATYKDKEDFVDTYPFVPYQFRLINYVFDSFSAQGFVTQGVKNTERSLLGITHYTAKNTQDQDTGYIIPFDAFFNSQLTENLTILATKKLDLAYKMVSGPGEKFAKRVINALFMIANLSEQHQRLFPANLDHLVYILMDTIDQDKVELQKQVSEVLENLVQHAIVIKSDTNAYRFLGDEERIVYGDIKNSRPTLNDVLENFEKDVLPSCIGEVVRKVSFDNNNYDVQFRIDDKDITGKGEFRIIFSVIDSSKDLSQLILEAAPQDIVFVVSPLFKSIRNEFYEYVQIVTYIRNNRDTSNKAKLDALTQFRHQADTRLSEIISKTEHFFQQANIISNGTVIKPGDITGSTSKSKFANALQSHLLQVYKKKQLANSYAQNEDMFKVNAKSTQLKTDETLTEAEREVSQVLDLMNPSMVNELIERFKKSPYGWKDVASLDILLQLARKGKRKFHFLNEPIDIREFAEKALNNRERQKIEVLPEDVIDNRKLYDVVQTVNRVFNKSILETKETDANVLDKKLKEYLRQQIDEAEELLNNHAAYPFSIHLKNYQSTLKKLAEKRDKMTLFNSVLASDSELHNISDNFKVTKEFIDEQFEDYKKIKSFSGEHESNFSSLVDGAREKGYRLVAYFQSDDKPQDSFKEIKLIHKELSKGVNELLKKLKEENLETYNAIFDRLETKVKELGLDGNYLPSRDYWIEKIKKLNSIPELRLELANAAIFETGIISKLYEEKQKQDEAKGKSGRAITFVSVVNDAGPSYIEIKTEQELEKFIEDFRKRVLDELKKNKIVGIKK